MGNAIARSVGDAFHRPDIDLWRAGRLFHGGKGGLVYTIQDPSTLYSDVGKTTLASVDGNVAAIADIINGHDATQGTGVQQGKLRQTASGFYEVELDGGDDYLQTGSFVLSQPNTFVFCVEMITLINPGDIFDSQNSAKRNLIFHRNNEIELNAGTTIATGVSLPAGETAIFTIIFDGANTNIWKNGVLSATVNPGTQDLDGVTVGARYDGAVNANMKLKGGLVLFDGRMTDSQRIQSERWIAINSGFPL